MSRSRLSTAFGIVLACGLMLVLIPFLLWMGL